MQYCEDSPVKKKKKKTITDNRICVIHQENATKSEISEFTETSWQTTLKASFKRDDGILLSFKSLPDPKIYGKHRTCYQIYTHPKNLSKFGSSEQTEDVRKSNRNKTKDKTILAAKECVLCKKQKTKSSGSGYEVLVKCTTIASAETLLQVASNSNNDLLDVEFTGKSNSEIIAKEYHYHRSCYKKKANDLSKDKSNSNNMEMRIREECFNELNNFVETHIIKNGQFLRMSEISNFYQELQTDRNLEIKGDLIKNIKTRLIKRHGEDTFTFFQKNQRSPEIVYCNQSERSKEGEFLLINSDEQVDAVANLIKSKIKEIKNPYSSWPAPACEVNENNVFIPKELYLFLQILFGKSAKGKILIRSIGQDIIYNTTRGRIKTVKHIQTGIVTKRKTGSKFMIDCLNRLGHSISYHEVNRIETFFAESQVNREKENIYVPNGIQPSTYVTFIYDNCDHNPESLSGVSMHCTNGIMVQRKRSDDILATPSAANQEPMKTIGKRRSFKPVLHEIAPYYPNKERTNPQINLDVERNINIINQLISKQTDILWCLGRYICMNEGKEMIPSWTGFHYEVASELNKDIDEVFYLPAINQSPTKLETVQEVLYQVKSKAQAIDLDCSDLVLDHAIYSKALEILQNPNYTDLKQFINLRLGGFHVCLNFLAVIGKRFASAGMVDLIVESDLLGPGSLESVIKGKQYNRGMRILKTLVETFQRLKFDVLKEWLRENGMLQTLTSFIESDELAQFIKLRTSNNLEKCLLKFEDLFNLIEDFEMQIKEGKFGPMAVMWQSYLDIAQIVLDFTKSNRSGDWDLHLQASEKMLVWFHAYDRHNYARHFTYYWTDQQKLYEQHPTIYEEFKNGHFTTKQTNGKFNRLPPDQVIEQTINRDQKGPGGIIGISTSTGSVQRWVLSSHDTSTLTANFRESLNLQSKLETPKDLGKSRKSLDEKNVQDCYNLVKSWGNPFEQSEHLYSLFSGKAASKEMEYDLLNAEKIGKTCLEDFITNRIESDKIPFYSPIKKNSLKTFDVAKKKLVRLKDRTVAVKSDRNTFARLLVIQQKRDIDIRKVLQFELSSLPLSIANEDGTLFKSQKSKLFSYVADQIPLVSKPSNIVHIYDGMVLFQKLPPTLTTFGDISDYILKKLLHSDSEYSFLVTDQYLPQSIKSIERERRSAAGSMRVIITRREQHTPKQFQKFLSNPDNKIDLVKFLKEDWTNNKDHILQLQERSIFVTCEDKAFCIEGKQGSVTTSNVPELSSMQEEADTKMFLCASYAGTLGIDEVNIVTVDSDVGILSLYYQREISTKILLEYGTATKTKIFDINANTLREDLVKALPSLHAFTGCDSTSSMCGIGKVKCYRMIEEDDTYLKAITSLGESLTLSEQTENMLEEYVCRLYGNSTVDDINEVRYRKFSANRVPDPRKLPPTQDALYLHIKRANYQSFEWKSALRYEYVSPVGYGWILEDEALSIQWTLKRPAPDEILEFIACNCKKSKCATKACQCKSVSLDCTDMCKCDGCLNGNVFDDNSADESTSSDSSDSSESEFENDDIY